MANKVDIAQLVEDLRGPIARALREAGFFELAPIAERAAEALAKASEPIVYGHSPLYKSFRKVSGYPITTATFEDMVAVDLDAAEVGAAIESLKGRMIEQLSTYISCRAQNDGLLSRLRPRP